MDDKPTYEELEQRVKDLEEKIEKQKNTDAALESLLKGTVRSAGEEFVKKSVKNLCAALNVKYAMIGVLTGEKRDRIKILAMWSPDGYIETFEYVLEGTPCEKVLVQDECLYFDEVQGQFVEDKAIVGMGVKSYFGSPLKNAKGEVFGILCLMHNEKMEDVDFKRKMLDLFSNRAEIEIERHMAEQALNKREETLNSIFKSAPTGIGLVSDRVIQQANDRLCEMVGYSKDELIGQSARMLYLSDEDYGFVGREKYDQIRKFGTGTVETRWRCKDGKVIDVLLSSTPIQPDDLSAGVTFSVLDITEQKRMIEQLKEDRDREQMFLDIAEVMFLALDTDGKVTLINKKGCEILGYTEAEILGRSWFDCFLTEGQREETRSVFQQLMVGKVKPAEYVESPVLTKDGENRHIDWHNILLKNKTGAIMGTFSSGEDITERKKAQEERMELQMQLQQVQKMEAIGTLAGGIAHDFNNILMPLLIHTEMVLEALPEDSPWIFNLEEVLKTAIRAKDLVKQILTFSRQSEEQKTHLKFRFVIEDCLKLLRSSLPATIDIQLNIKTQPGMDTVYADPNQLHQVLMNLCTNAYHAMREKGGILEIRLVNINIDSNTEAVLPDLISGIYHQLSVRDTGSGMEKETMDRIFDPYFTTKEKGEGTGLGLSVVHGIVKNHQGVITVESKPGEGTTFHVFLPVAEKEEKIEIKKVVGMPKGDECVLFVDDEQSVTKVIKVMLERLGYTVKIRTNSLEALEAFRANPDKFDLLITDQTMPHMTGSELARKIMHIRQDIPVIICSGFSEQMNEEKAQKMGIRAFVMKPVIMSELAQIIRKVLDQKD